MRLRTLAVTVAFAVGVAAIAPMIWADEAGGPVREAPAAQGPEGLFQTYSDAATFDAAFPGLPVEDFSATLVAPNAQGGCDEPIDAASNDACFAPGTIDPRLVVETVGGGYAGCPGDCPLAVDTGTLGQTDVLVGTITAPEALRIDFAGPDADEICALGFDAYAQASDTWTVTVEFTLSGTQAFIVPASATGEFFGVSGAGDPILSVELASSTPFNEWVSNVRIGVGSCAQATMTMVDAPGTTAVPGDTISYEVELSNTGAFDIDQADFDVNLDPNVTAADAATTTPLAVDDGLYEGHPVNPVTVDGTLQPVLLDNDFGIPGTPTLAVLPVVAEPTTLGGSVDINADGSFTYTPPPGATGGEIDTFTYDVQNGIPPSSPATDSATASIILGLPPALQDDAITITQNTSAMFDAAADNGSGADDFGIPAGVVDLYGPVGGPLTTAPGAALTTANGNMVTFDVSGDGTFTYDATGAPTFSGVDTFEYQVTNSVGSDTAVVTVEVQAPPTAVADLPDMLSSPGDAFHTAINTTLDSTAHATPSVMDNDDRGFPLADVVSYGTSASPTDQTVPGAATATDNGGTVVVSADGNFVYTPPSATFTGPDMFGYRIQNAAGFSDATVTIAVGTRPQCDDELTPDDDYDALGNVGISVPNTSGVLIGDTGDQITVTGNTAPTSGGTAVVATDGGFDYTSGPGFTGVDAFTYTVGNGFGDSAACTVNVTVANTIWFIDNTAAAGGTGTLAAPFDNIGDMVPASDDPGDVIFLYEGDGTTTNYSQGITLKDNQLLIGQGVDLATGAGLTPPTFSATLPGVAGRPELTNSGNVILLASGNTVRGLDVTNPLGTSIVANGSNGVTVSDTGLNGGSSGIEFTNATGTIDVDNLDASTGSSFGVSISGGSASYNFDAASSITNTTGAAFRLTGGTASVTYSGNISQANNAPAVDISSHTTGTVTFQTGTISATNGTGLQFNDADGAAYNFNGTTTLNGGDAGIDILGGSSGSFTFGTGTSITSPSGTAFNVDGLTGDILGLTYSGSIVQANNATTVSISNHTTTGAPIVFDASSTINATNGNGLQFSDADRVYTFNGTVTLNGGDAGIDIINNSGGTFNFGSGVSVTSPTGAAFRIDLAQCFVNFDGSLTQANNAPVVEILNHTPLGAIVDFNGSVSATNGTGIRLSNADGTVRFDGAVTLNGGDAGIDILTSSSGTFTFANTTITSPTGPAVNVSNSAPTVNYEGGGITQANASAAYQASNNTGGSQTIGVAIDADTSLANAIDLTNNTGVTFSFNGALDLDTTTGYGFSATSGGTVQNDSTDTHTVNSGTGIGIHILNTTIGSSGLTFRSVSSNGSTSGIVLFNTGTGGGLTITGDGSNTRNGSGGTIQNTTSHGISLSGTDSFSATSLNLTSPGDGNIEHGINAVNLTGSGGFRAGIVTGISQTSGDGIRIVNTNTNLTLFEVRDSLFIGQNLGGNDGVFVNGLGNSVMRIDVVGSSTPDSTTCTGTTGAGFNQFDSMFGDGVQVNPEGSSTITLNLRNSCFTSTQNFSNPNGTGGCVNLPNCEGGVSRLTSLLAGTGTLRATIENNVFQDTGTQAGVLPVSSQVGVADFVANDDSTLRLRFRNNLIEDVEIEQALRIIGDDNATEVDAVISNNTIRDVLDEDAIFLYLRDSTVLGNITIQGNNIGSATDPIAEHGIEFRVQSRNIPPNPNNAINVNTLISGNNIVNNDSSSESIDLESEVDNPDGTTLNPGATLNATVTGNTLTNQGTGDELEADSEDGPVGANGRSVLCLNMSGNTLASGGGTLVVDEDSGADLNIVQTSAANLASANGIPAGNVTTAGSPNFGAVASCTQPTHDGTLP